MADKESLLKNIFEANLAELIEIQFSEELNQEPVAHWYARVMKAYFENDLEMLLLLRSEIPECAEKPVLDHILELRILIRKNEVTPSEISQLSLNQLTFPDLWKGEVYFCLGMLFSYTQDSSTSRKFYKLAIQAYSSCGCYKKSVKSILNFIVAESKIYPQKSFIPEYQYLIKKALEVNEIGVAGVCHLNISQEYEIFQAYDAALEECDNALKLITGDLGGTHCSFVRLQRAHLLWLLGRPTESKMEIDKVATVNHKEINAAKKALNFMTSKAIFESKIEFDREVYADLTSPWREKIERFLHSGRKYKAKSNLTELILTEMENKFIKFLSSGKKSKFEIIEFLYGDKISIDSSENRMRVFLFRLRKKRPDLVLFKDDLYYLNLHFISELRQKIN